MCFFYWHEAVLEPMSHFTYAYPSGHCLCEHRFLWGPTWYVSNQEFNPDYSPTVMARRFKPQLMIGAQFRFNILLTEIRIIKSLSDHLHIFWIISFSTRYWIRSSWRENTLYCPFHLISSSYYNWIQTRTAHQSELIFSLWSAYN